MDRPYGQRDMVFCHECEHEWYRDEHGLTCPRCQSDFTEIIEENHDPREDYASDIQSLPGLIPLGQGDAPDPDEEDVNRFSYTPHPDGFSMHSAFSNAQAGASSAPTEENRAMVANNFTSMLAGILGIHPQPAQTAVFPGGRSTTRSYNLGNSRITYTSASFSGSFPPPRDANQMQPGPPPGEYLNTYVRNGASINYLNSLNSPRVLSQLFAGLDANPRPREMAHPPPMGPVNPLSSLLSVLFNPANAQHGDAVYTQEALDRVISQLMEQNGMGNAPGPADPQEIANLPKKQVDKNMLGDNGKAECSICMDEVHLGDEVVRLYCSHWFHEQCVGAWLGEHDTCPHCRKGIRQAKEESQGRSSTQPNAPAPPRPAAQRRESSFSSHRRRSNTDTTGGNSSSGGGITERVRNFFGRS